MTYTDYFLKFPSKQQAIQVFSTIPNHVDGNTGEPVTQTENFAIDQVGILYNDDAIINENGFIVTPPTKKDGYHYNYRIVYGNKPESPLPSQLQPYLVHPEHPQRVFL
jgi:hypothetical protein